MMLSLSMKPWSMVSSRIPSGLDIPLVMAVLALISIGFVMVTSASITFADHNYKDGFYFMKRHLMYLLMASALALVVLQVPVKIWYRYSNLLLFGTFLLLVLVLIPGVGREVNGSRRWIGFGGFNLQVAEVAKLSMVVFMASYLQRHQLAMRESWRESIKPMLLLGLLAGLLLLQPDFGSTVVIASTVLGLLFLAGMPLLVFTGLLVMAGGSLALLAVISPYRMQRLVTFLDPWADQFDSGYQLTQSLIAYGRGEWLGVGLGNSVQKLFYLPEAHTDFVFAIYAEEFGLVGIAIVLALFIVLTQRIFVLARRAVQRQDWFAAYAAFGIGMLIAGQAFINVGVTSGLLPTKGLTLPFISYGGSSLLVSCAMVALVLRIGADMQDGAWTQQVSREHGKS